MRPWFYTQGLLVAAGVGGVRFSKFSMEAISKTVHFAASAASGICKHLPSARHCPI